VSSAAPDFCRVKDDPRYNFYGENFDSPRRVSQVLSMVGDAHR